MSLGKYAVGLLYHYVVDKQCLYVGYVAIDYALHIHLPTFIYRKCV